jgi:hypothetical protein
VIIDDQVDTGGDIQRIQVRRSHVPMLGPNVTAVGRERHGSSVA